MISDCCCVFRWVVTTRLLLLLLLLPAVKGTSDGPTCSH